MIIFFKSKFYSIKKYSQITATLSGLPSSMILGYEKICETEGSYM